MDQEQRIRIQNFRCFKDLEVKGFKRVNLIGGQNNIGKTTLLEALSLYFHPNPSSISCLKEVRKESDEELTKRPKDAWKNLFHGENDTDSIFLDGCFNGDNQNIVISVRDAIQIGVFETFFEDIEGTNIAKKMVSLLQETNPKSTLEIQRIHNKYQPSKRYIVANTRGLFSPDFNHQEPIPFLSSYYYLSNEQIARKYDRIDFDGKGKEVLQLLQTLDESIEGLRTYSHIEPTLYVQTKTQKRGLPITLFGDAIYRTTVIALELLSQENPVLFIDEIENGIHHTNQTQS